MSQKNKRLFSLKDILPQAMKGVALDPKTSLMDLQNHWTELVGELLARKSYPFRIYNKRLLVSVEGSAWANELDYLKAKLKEKIKKTLPHLTIQEIRFQIFDK